MAKVTETITITHNTLTVTIAPLTRAEKEWVDKHGPALMAYWRGKIKAMEARVLGACVEGDKS